MTANFEDTRSELTPASFPMRGYAQCTGCERRIDRDHAVRCSLTQQKLLFCTEQCREQFIAEHL